MVDDRHSWGLIPIYYPNDLGSGYRPSGTGIGLDCRTIATARHVIDPGFKPFAVPIKLASADLQNHAAFRARARGLTRDVGEALESPVDVKLHPTLDLALLRFDRPVVDMPAVWVVDLDDVPLKDLEGWTLIRAGYPTQLGGETLETTEPGSESVRVEATRGAMQALTFLRVHGVARHGYSGGALLRSLSGETPSVIGLLYIGREEAAIMAAIPTGEVLRFAADFGWRPDRIAFAAEAIPDENEFTPDPLTRRQHRYARAYPRPDGDEPHFTLSEDDLAIPMAVIPPGEFQFPQAGTPGGADKRDSLPILRPYAIMRSVITPRMVASLLKDAPDLDTLDLPLTGITFRDAGYLAEALSRKFGRNIVLPDRARWHFALFTRGQKVTSGARQAIAAHPWGISPAPGGRYEWVIDPDFQGSRTPLRGGLCRDPDTPAPLMYAGDREVRPEATVRLILEL